MSSRLRFMASMLGRAEPAAQGKNPALTRVDAPRPDRYTGRAPDRFQSQRRCTWPPTERPPPRPPRGRRRRAPHPLRQGRHRLQATSRPSTSAPWWSTSWWPAPACRPATFDAVIFGQVVPSKLVTLIGREMVLRTQLPRSVEAHTVARACATSLQAATGAADQIALGPRRLRHRRRRRVDLRRAHLRLAAGWRRRWSSSPRPAPWRSGSPSSPRSSPRDLRPEPPALKEPTTGLTMGESAEQMAQKNGISRARPGRARAREPPARRRRLGGRRASTTR